MAKLKSIDKITKDYVAAVRFGWNGDLAFTPAVLEWLRECEIDQIDILEVVEDGDPVTVAKETADETLIEFAGKTIPGTPLRVVVSFNPHRNGLCVMEVSVL